MIRLVLVDDDGWEITASGARLRLTQRPQFSAAELVAREALRARVRGPRRRPVPPPVLIASLTSGDRVRRMALHKQVHGVFGPDLARTPGT